MNKLLYDELTDQEKAEADKAEKELEKCAKQVSVQNIAQTDEQREYFDKFYDILKNLKNKAVSAYSKKDVNSLIKDMENTIRSATLKTYNAYKEKLKFEVKFFNGVRYIVLPGYVSEDNNIIPFCYPLNFSEVVYENPEKDILHFLYKAVEPAIIGLSRHGKTPTETDEIFLKYASKKANELNGCLFAVKSRSLQTINYPTEELNRTFIRDIRESDANKIAKSNKILWIYYPDSGYNIDHALTAYDKLIMCLSYNLAAQNEYGAFSINTLYRQLGNKTSPNNEERERLWQSIDKLQSIKIKIEDQNGKKKFESFGRLLNAKRVKAEVNGKVSADCVRIFDIPPLIELALRQNQMTTLDISVIQAPINKTQRNIELLTYLIERVNWIKKDPTAPKNILYSTLFCDCNINDRLAKNRAKRTIADILTHFKKTGFIVDYALNSTNIIIQTAQIIELKGN